MNMKHEVKKFVILGLIAALCSIAVPVMALDLPIVDCPTTLNSCTANDVSTTVTNVAILDNRCEADGTIDLRITADYSTAGGDSRYDLGVFVAEDGGSLSGSDPTAEVCSGAYGPIPPFIDLDESTPGDTCGDISDETITWTFDVTADCSNIVDGVLDVPSCRFWNIAGHNDLCSGSPGENAGTGAKCDCTPFEVTVPTNPCDDVICAPPGDCQNPGVCDPADGICDYEPIPGCGTPVPEFPSLALPAAMIIGFLGAVLFIQGTKKQ